MIVCRPGFAFIVAASALLLGGCAIRLTHPDTFQTGQVLDKGQAEVEAHSFGPEPEFATVAYGIADGWELRGGAGRIGDPLAAGLSVTSNFIETEHWFASGSFGLEVLSPPEKITYAGFRVSGTYAAGWFPTTGFGFFVPLKVSVVHVPPGTYQRTGYFPGYTNSAFVPGLGASWRWQGLVIRAAANVPVQFPGGKSYVWQEPYAGLQLGYDFRLTNPRWQNQAPR